MESVIAAFITGVMALLGVIITSGAAGRRMSAEIHTAQAVSDAKIEELTREVRLHNGFAQRIPAMEEQLKAQNWRLTRLEKERSTI